MRRALADSKAAADAAKQSADAATTAAESAMATDRAWLILEKLEEPHLVPLPLAGTPPPPVQALHCYINFGKTPAFITAIQAQIIKLPRLADLPPEPNYNSVKAELNLPDVPIAAGTRTNPLWAILESKPLLSQQEIDEINQSAVFLYAFGYIRYRDVFRRAHETRWGCELIVPGGANMQYYWRMAGPHTYNNFD